MGNPNSWVCFGLHHFHPDLQSFREALAVLQHQVDELDALKASHYQEIMEHEEEVWEVVQGKVCLWDLTQYIETD